VELTAQLAMDLAVAAVPVLAPAAAASGHARRPSAVIGRDSRASGDFLEAAVVAGLASSGVDVLRLGVIPTPGVAYLTGALNADFGVVLSASHNPAADNGIKFFGRSGVKLPDEIEDEIEARLRAAGDDAPVTSLAGDPSPLGFGRVTDAYSAHETYLDHLLASLPTPATGQLPLHGMRVVVDCAHGAAYSIGPRALRRAGAEVIAIGAAPDGLNINASVGSTHLDTLAAAVLEHGADAGLAFDGDADRCLAIDGDGQPLDGDQILAVLASQLKRSNQLIGDTVVVTVMSNLGFHDAMRESGITVIETPVGDKHVYAAMRDGGYILGIPVSAAAKMMTRYPQVLINVRGNKDRAMADPAVAHAVTAAKSKLGDAGRVLLRPSGTEPVIRVMVETRQSDVAERVAGQLADAVREAMS
jgi:phosphoglucosamine mutase